jgi:hypothetical protein
MTVETVTFQVSSLSFIKSTALISTGDENGDLSSMVVLWGIRQTLVPPSRGRSRLTRLAWSLCQSLLDGLFIWLNLH